MNPRNRSKTAHARSAPLRAKSRATSAAAVRSELARLSNQLGRPDLHLAILGEGNASAVVAPLPRSGPRRRPTAPGVRFFVKPSGGSLASLRPQDLVQCDSAALTALVERARRGQRITDDEQERALYDARIDPRAPKPSVEAMFHAWLLERAWRPIPTGGTASAPSNASGPAVAFVAHTHPVSVNAILCSQRAEEFARSPLFPDQIVCCGRRMLTVDYTDPGCALAAAIADAVESSQSATEPVRVLLLKNHGVIALGSTAQGALATTLMCDKAARIFIHAASLSLDGIPTPLDPAQADRIAGRSDEEYRRRALRL